MDSSNFVLLASAFMIVTTVMVTFSQWEYVPNPKAVPHFACRFDSFCQGSDCGGALPADIFIVPQAKDQPAYMTDSLTSGSLTSGSLTSGSRTALDTVALREWVGRRGEAGMVRLRLGDGDALTVTETASFTPDSPVLSFGAGQCRDMTATDQEQG